MTEQAQTTQAGGSTALDLSPVVKKTEQKPVGFEVLEVTEEKNAIVAVRVKISPADYSERYTAHLKKLRRDVHIDGFRPGKVPERMLRQLYGRGLEYQVAEDAKEEVVRKAGADKGYQLVGTSDIKDVKVENGVAEVTYVFEIIPKISVPDAVLDTIEVKVETREVGDTDVEATIARLLDQNATFEARADDGKIEKGDGVIVTTTVTGAGGRNIAEESVFEQFVGSLEQAFPAEVVAALQGKKKGESVTVTVEGKLSPDAPEGAPAPEAKTFHVDVLGVKAKKLPVLDDEFAKDVDAKYATLADLRADIRRELTERTENKKRQDTFVAVYDKLVEKVPFEVPQTLVYEATQNWVNRDKEMLRQQGTSLNQVFGKSINTYYEAAQLGAERGVKALLMARAISEQLGLSVSDDELTAEYERLGKEAGRSGLAIKAHHEARKTVEDVKQNLLRRKADEYLLKRVKVEYVLPKKA